LTFRLLCRPPAIGALLLCAVALSACGESAQDKAKAEVCGSRSAISKQITKLQGLGISASTLTEAKAGFEVINRELTKIQTAQSKLDPARKQQVQSASENFASQFSSIAGGLVASLGSGNIEAALKNAGPQLKAALNKLSGAYKQALAPINC
jgi:hypothetical protein